MKPIVKLGGLVIVLLFALTACNLIKTIDVGWAITSTFEETDPITLAGNSFVDIYYTVSNNGKYDLSGVKLYFRLYIATSGGSYDAVTPSFNISQGQTLKNNLITIDTFPFHFTGNDFAEVIDVSMDKPSD